MVSLMVAEELPRWQPRVPCAPGQMKDWASETMSPEYGMHGSYYCFFIALGKKMYFLLSFLESLRAAVWTDVSVQVLAASPPPPKQTLPFAICFCGCMGNQLGKCISNFKTYIWFVALDGLFSTGVGFLAGLQLILSSCVVLAHVTGQHRGQICSKYHHFLCGNVHWTTTRVVDLSLFFSLLFSFFYVWISVYMRILLYTLYKYIITWYARYVVFLFLPTISDTLKKNRTEFNLSFIQSQFTTCTELLRDMRAKCTSCILKAVL